MKESFFHHFYYRCWQFYKAVLPDFASEDWEKAKKRSYSRLLPLLDKLGKAEKAHVLRILAYISEDTGLSSEEKELLSGFALVHDIGKAITKPSLAFKVAKVLFKLNGNAHCITGARAVWKLTRNKSLAVRVLRHHEKPGRDKLVSLFQLYDDKS